MRSGGRRDLERGVAARERPHAARRLGGDAGAGAADEQAVVGPRVGAHAQAERVAPERRHLEHVAGGGGERRAGAPWRRGCPRCRGAGTRRDRGTWPARVQPANACSGRPGTSTRMREQAAGVRQARELGGVAVHAGGGHVERAQVRAAECAHRRAHRGHRILGERAPGRRELDHLAAAEERDPVVAFAVHGGAVRAVGLALPLHERARTRRRAGGRVVRERAHACAWACRRDTSSRRRGSRRGRC